jgi:hypothetical protein
MKLDFNFLLEDLNGNKIDNANAGKLMAGALAGSSKGNSLKFWSWAQKLHKGEVLELDPSDEAMLKEFINENEGFTVLAKAQILAVFK